MSIVSPPLSAQRGGFSFVGRTRAQARPPPRQDLRREERAVQSTDQPGAPGRDEHELVALESLELREAQLQVREALRMLLRGFEDLCGLPHSFETKSEQGRR